MGIKNLDKNFDIITFEQEKNFDKMKIYNTCKKSAIM